MKSLDRTGEIIKYIIDSSKILYKKNNNIKLVIKLEYICEEPEFSHVIVDNSSLNGKILSGGISPSIQVTDCFTTSKHVLEFLDTRFCWLLILQIPKNVII